MSTGWALIATALCTPSVVLLSVVIIRSFDDLFVHIGRDADE